MYTLWILKKPNQNKKNKTNPLPHLNKPETKNRGGKTPNNQTDPQNPQQLIIVPLNSGWLITFKTSLMKYAAFKGCSCSISRENGRFKKKRNILAFLFSFTGKLGALFPCHTLSGFFRGQSWHWRSSLVSSCHYGTHSTNFTYLIYR